MILKFNNYSNNKKGKQTVLGYLLDDARVERGEAYVVKGDVNFTKHLIESNRRKHTYVSGGLMFDKDDVITDEQERKIIDYFEKMMFIGMDKSQYHILWVKHVDKGRTELNFVVPRQELSRGIDLDVYSHRRDKPLFNMWKNGINKKYGLADPNAESRKRTASERAEKQKERGKGDFENSFVATRGNLDKHIQELVSTGVLQSKDEIIKFLKSEGFTVRPNTKNHISVKADSLGKRALRLQAHPIYQDAFKSLDDLPQIEAAKEEDQPIKFDSSVYSKYLKTRYDRHIKRYSKIKKTVEADLAPSKKVTQPITLSKKEDYDTSRETASRSQTRDIEERQAHRGATESIQDGARGLVKECFGVHQDRSEQGNTKPTKKYNEKLRSRLTYVSRQIEKYADRQRIINRENQLREQCSKLIVELGDTITEIGKSLGHIRQKLVSTFKKEFVEKPKIANEKSSEVLPQLNSAEVGVFYEEKDDMLPGQHRKPNPFS